MRGLPDARKNTKKQDCYTSLDVKIKALSIYRRSAFVNVDLALKNFTVDRSFLESIY